MTDEQKIVLITNEVSEYYGISVELMKGKTRKREVVVARQVAQALCCIFLSVSLQYIGNFFGGRDHTTVIHSKLTVKDMCATDKDYYMMYLNVLNIIKNKLNKDAPSINSYAVRKMKNPKGFIRPF